ncbi:MAG: ATP-NAD kinase family protein [Gammaproteobacteria bacterium]|nr:ATP-NAD kinase family protein [Gammaproteobacteria bacterium]MBT8135178.1 ATP-NAD kinase family protein [Gammaproteobacteria bacterium]NNJ50522.1 ATP-NAD kinase family protein [Gammaproteobacteria bacterium]
MKLGFVINPLAGIGGPVALKGSDGSDIVELALSRGASLKAEKRASAAVEEFSGLAADERLEIVTAAAAMGENVLAANGLDCRVVYTAAEHTTSADTKNAVRLFVEHEVDLILFAGGDGTARDVLDVLSKEFGSEIPVVGIPAGVKIHSAVYAVTPSQAGELINLLISGEPMSLQEARVMDLDEDAFREGEVIARCYGYLSVPVDDTRMQLIKQGGINHHEIALQDIAADVIESMEPDTFYLIGSGSTTAEIMKQMALDNTLLGIDIVYNHELLASDVDEQTILKTIDDHPAKMVVTVIGGQGHVFGRGNQQLSADVIRHVGQDNIIIVATNDKLRSLNKRPMISDTGDIDLDRQLRGLYPVVTGYQQHTLYRLK